MSHTVHKVITTYEWLQEHRKRLLRQKERLEAEIADCNVAISAIDERRKGEDECPKDPTTSAANPDDKTTGQPTKVTPRAGVAIRPT